MYFTDLNTTPRSYDSYKKEYNTAGKVKKVDFYWCGSLAFSWIYSYDDTGLIETGCQIVTY